MHPVIAIILMASSFLVMSACDATAADSGNLCANPGFEMLNPAGDNFPLNWGGRSHDDQAMVAIDKDAYGGSIAIRMIGP